MFDEEIDSTANLLGAALSFVIVFFLVVFLVADINSRGCIRIITILNDNNTGRRFFSYSNSISLAPFSSILKFKNAKTNEYVYLKNVSFTISNKCLKQ